MRIVNLKEFLYLPAGTVFAKFYPTDFDPLAIKGENGGNQSYYYQPLLEVEGVKGEDSNLTLIKRMEDGQSFNLDLDCEERDESYHQLFAVFERKDVLQLMSRLHKAYTISGMPEEGWAEVDRLIQEESYAAR